MKSHFFTTALAILLTVTLIAPPVFFIVPQRAGAQIPVTVTSEISPTAIKRTVESVIQTITQKITEINTATTAWATTAAQINTYVLQPLAFVLSGNLMKALTASVIAFVIGKANGTGVPQFVVDVNRSLQTVGDSQALAYLRQFGTNSNSPFSASIASALKNNYLQKTSLAGFWAANMNTLAQTSPNVPAFLSGQWSQGGVAAWFALTTQVQNNPYTFYQASQAQMSGLVGSGAGGATGARLATLSYGSGFMSWCGDLSAESTPNISVGDSCTTVSGQIGTKNASGACVATGSATGVNPGDACTNKDGTAGTIKTPGSVISATLNKVLGGQQDQIVRMGNVGGQITQILGNIATVMQTVQFASQILGGTGSGGLFGVNSTSAAGSRSALTNFTPTQTASGSFTSGYLGASNAGVYQTAATIGASGSDKLKLITDYQSAWSTISAAANAASTTVQALVSYCNAQAKYPIASQTAISAQVSAAQTALTTEINPVLAQAASADKASADATAMVQKVQAELNSGSDSTGSTYAADIQTLQTMPPTASDFANALQDAQVFGQAVASPDGSLTVSGSSLVDQMNLISANAAALKLSACTLFRFGGL